MNARQLRKEIGETGFEYWVRQWKNGDMWVSARWRSDHNELVNRLTELGYRVECNGKPGTAGEHIIEVCGKLP